MTDKEKAIIMAHTGICMLEGDKFQIFHKYIEDIMGRPIFTHEIGWLEDEIKERSKTDFIALCADESDSQEPNKSEIPTGSTTKNDLGIDCISRKELLKIYENRFIELQKLKHLKDNKGAEDRQMGVNYCINILKEMPPVTSAQKWIPVSERLPEEIGTYLVTLEYKEHGKGITTLWYHGKQFGWDLRVADVVIAWMPLPKAYEPQESVE